jgi:hypothetical protein
MRGGGEFSLPKEGYFSLPLDIVAEEDAQHPGDGEDNLAVGDIQKKLFSHPLAPLLQPLGVAGRTKSSGATGKHHEALLPTVRTADAGKSATGVAAIEASLRGAKRRGNLIPQAKHHEITTALRAS